MDDLFLILMLVSIACFLLSLIKPTLFSRLLGLGITRKKAGLIFSVATFVFFVLFGITHPDKTKEKTDSAKAGKQLAKNEPIPKNTSNQVKPETLPDTTRNPIPEVIKEQIDTTKTEKLATSIVKESNINNDLIEAAYRSNLGEVKRLLNEGADVNSRTDGGVTTLIAAYFGGNIEILRLLLDKGADVNSKAAEGVTPLIAACYGGHIEVVRLLLDKGADLNARDENDSTALMKASNGGLLDVVKVLLDKGAEVNAKTCAGGTALMFASYSGHPEVVKVLLDKRTEVNAKDKDGTTALMFASLKGHIEIVELLLDKVAVVNAKDDAGKTALMFASQEGHIEIVELLLDKVVDVNAKDDAGKTALMFASQGGHTQVAKVLRDRGAGFDALSTISPLFLLLFTGSIVCLIVGLTNPNVFSRFFKGEITRKKLATVFGVATFVFFILFGMTATSETDYKNETLRKEKQASLETSNVKASNPSLMEAASKGRLEEVKRLLEEGADVNEKDDRGSPALLEATFNGHIEIVRLLLDKGADVNIEDKIGWTALIWASKEGFIDIVRLLLDKGADPNIKNDSGHTALIRASWDGHQDVVNLLKPLVKNETKQEINAASQSHLKEGTDVNTKNKDGMEALISASSKDNLEEVKRLLKEGVDVNTKNKDGWSALFFASNKGNRLMAKALLDAGADVHAKDKDGHTALWWAQRKGNREVENLLVKRGSGNEITIEATSTRGQAEDEPTSDGPWQTRGAGWFSDGYEFRGGVARVTVLIETYSFYVAVNSVLEKLYEIANADSSVKRIEVSCIMDASGFIDRFGHEIRGDFVKKGKEMWSMGGFIFDQEKIKEMRRYKDRSSFTRDKVNQALIGYLIRGLNHSQHIKGRP